MIPKSLIKVLLIFLIFLTILIEFLKFFETFLNLICVVNGTKMFFYVFYSLLTYSNNLKLTIFLSERALLLYSEFIIMSRDKKIIDDYYYKPNLNDAISFAYKQTIGSLSLNELKTNIKLIPVRECSNILIEIYNKVYFKYSEDIDTFSNFIEALNDNFVASLLSLFNKLLV